MDTSPNKPMIFKRFWNPRQNARNLSKGRPTPTALQSRTRFENLIVLYNALEIIAFRGIVKQTRCFHKTGLKLESEKRVGLRDKKLGSGRYEA